MRPLLYIPFAVASRPHLRQAVRGIVDFMQRGYGAGEDQSSHVFELAKATERKGEYFGSEKTLGGWVIGGWELVMPYQFGWYASDVGYFLERWS